MALTLPLGQYQPGVSAVHTTDARVKIALMLVFALALFIVDTWWGLAALTLVTVLLYRVAHISFRAATRGLVPILIIASISFIANSFTFTDADFTIIGSFGITSAGVLRGLFFAVRIILLVVATSLVTYTTAAVELTDALVQLLNPLKRIKVPVDDIAMICSIAIRFIPLTAEEAFKIKTAQEARGAQFGQGGLIKRLKAWIPVLIPLFVKLFRRADGLARAMDTRCYDGKTRTMSVNATMTQRDYGVLVVFLLIFVVIAIFL